MFCIGDFSRFSTKYACYKKENNIDNRFSLAIIDSRKITCLFCFLGSKKGTFGDEKIEKCVGRKTSKWKVIVSDDDDKLSYLMLTSQNVDQ